MKVVVLGAGQLGLELIATCPDTFDLVVLSRKDVDITNEAQLSSMLADETPACVINAVAYTAVDKAETDSDLAIQVNAHAVQVLAVICHDIGAKLIHISTDFVFDGFASTPYREGYAPSPLSAYGRSKLQGEQAVMKYVDNYIIFRTAWVYSSFGNNFVKTMLALMSSKDALSVVADQKGSPTYARGLAELCWWAVSSTLVGIFHYTDDGETTWYEFAKEIQTQALSLGLLDKKIPVKPIGTVDYPTAAARPHYSVLDKSKIIAAGVTLKPWKVQLNRMLMELVDR